MTEPDTTSGQAEAAARRVDYARNLLLHSRDELRFADAKASSLFTIISAAIGIAAGACIALSWSPAQLSAWAAILSWVVLVLALLSVVMTGAAIYPRTGPGPGVSRPTDHVIYFGDVARYSSVETLQAALDRSAGDEYRLIGQELLAVSKIAAVKYRLLAASLWLLLLDSGVALATIFVAVR